MTRRPHLLLVGGKDSGFRSISELPVDVTLVQTRGSVTPLQLAKVRRLLVVDEISTAVVCDLARQLHGRHPVDGVLSFFEECLIPASLAGEDLGVRCNPLQPVRSTWDKLVMRSLLAEAGVRTVRFARCDAPDDLHRFIEKARSPTILKPAQGSGSRGVVLVRRADEVAPSWAWCLAGGNLPAIAEEYVEGPEFSVETLSLDGHHTVLAVTEKLTTGVPNFIEVGHQLPARLPSHVTKRVHDTVVELLDVIGHRFGPAHTELRLGMDGEPVVIESQTRFGGDQIWEMVELVTGVPLAGTTAAALLGVPPIRRPVRAGAAAIRFFTPENGTVDAIDGVDRARARRGILRVDMRARPGQQLGPLRGSWDRQGYVLAVGDDVEEAVDNADAASRLVRFHLL